MFEAKDSVGKAEKGLPLILDNGFFVIMFEAEELLVEAEEGLTLVPDEGFSVFPFRRDAGPVTFEAEGLGVEAEEGLFCPFCRDAGLAVVFAMAGFEVAGFPFGTVFATAPLILLAARVVTLAESASCPESDAVLRSFLALGGMEDGQKVESKKVESK